MTLQMLEYFIALAEYRSFTEAAAACFVSQPALSRAIAALEKEMDCALVERDKRKNVCLTPAGETLLIEARRLFGQIDVMRERVRLRDQRCRLEVSVGYIDYGILRDFRRRCAGVLSQTAQAGIHIRTVYGSSRDLRERVLSGEIDFALLIDSSTYDMPGCSVLPAFSVEKRIMLPKQHPLFERESVYLAELADSAFVFFDPRDLPLLYADNIEMCRRAGVTPKIIGFGHKAGDVVSLVQQYGAAAFMSESFDYAQSSDLRLVRIADEFIRQYDVRYVLAMREHPVNPAAEQLAAIVRSEMSAESVNHD